MTSVKFLASASMLVLLSACAVQPSPFTPAELKAQAQADKAEMFTAEPVTRPVSLADAVARALKHNLDHRTKVMEQALALGQTKVDRWDLLPKLAANAGYAGRSEPYATVSRTRFTQRTGADTEPTYSADRDAITADLTLSWNVLDFGVSYFNAHQNADRALIAEERRRKTVHNLVQEVRFAFWRAAAAQVLEAEVRQAIGLAEQALGDARRVEAARLRNPAEALRFQKTLLENLRQLEGVSQELSTARVELAALMDLPPGTEFTLEVPADSTMAPPSVAMAVEQMEETALVNNADLREQGYNARIAVDETRKTILKLLPGLSFTAGRNYDSNSFLVDNRWYEAGARVTWNLFNLISAPDQIANAEAGETVAKARRQALHMAVLAQVHIGLRQFNNASKQYIRADELYQVEKRLADFTKVRADNDAQSVMEQITNQTSAIAASLRRYQSYAQMQSSLGRLYATMGQDFLPGTVASQDLDDLSRRVALSLEEWGHGLSDQAPETPAPVKVPEPEPALVPAAVPVAAKPALPPAKDDIGMGSLFSHVGDWFDPAAKPAAAQPANPPAKHPDEVSQMRDRISQLVAESAR
ncbi:MAG: TolC family protein [Magnetospirillum sp.]|nr:TolC family protein [Magnetospirillum sp.]